MAYSRHPVRLAGVLGGSLGLVLALAASPFASQASAAETHGAGDARPAVSDGTWGQAKEVPGTAALNAGGQAGIASVSCASAGNCSAGGSYEDASGHAQAFVAGEVDGMWGQAKEVPGTATLNSGGDAGVLSVSCASAGNCSAGGEYEGTSGHIQAFVAGEVNGVWGLAKEVPGSAVLNTGEDAQVISVSCASAGNCSAGGFYLALVSPGVHHGFAFVVSEVNGVWGQAQEVPGLAALGSKLGAETMSVSCASAGNCTAGGSFESFDHTEAFVVGEVNGVWGQAQEVPGLAALNTLGDAEVRSVSCGSAGNCAAGGFYLGTSDHTQAFVASEVNGVWGQAKEVPGTAALNTGGFAQVLSASCASAGNCSAGGYYTDSSGHAQAFVAGEVNGVWGQAKEVPGTAALNAGDGAEIVSVSCSSAGNCSAGGGYDVPSNHAEAFVVSEANGVWGQAKEVPGTAALNAGGQAAINSVSCASPGYCSAGGSYLDASSHQQAFVVSDAN